LAFASRCAGQSIFTPGKKRDFVIKTLLRSESQRVVWAASLGLGLVMAAIVLVSTFQGHAVTANADPSSQILALPLVISYCGIIGLRFVFDIPVDLRANWIFRVMLDTQEHNCLAVARKTMFICVVSSVSVMTLVAFTLFWGWRLGVQHSVLVASCSWLLIEVSIVSLRKLPFTCSAQEFHSRGLVNALGYVLGLFVFAFSTTSIEHWCIRAPFRMLLFVPLLATGFWLARRYCNELLDNEKTLIFEDSTASSLELLNLVGQPNA
jgi:hypothetical protein